MDNNTLVVVATEKELELAKERFKTDDIVQTGIGGTNVIRALKHFYKWRKIINFGYAGSNSIPVGTEVHIGNCKLYHPNVEYDEPVFELKGDTQCYTSDDFVLQTNIEEPCVFDMELAYILALGFEDVESIKIVSDNLSLEQYDNVVKEY